MSSELRPELVLGTLTPAEREVLEGWLETLGFGAHDWLHVPHVLPFLELVAVMRVSAGYDSENAEVRVLLAAEDLGIEDAGRAHPAKKLIRRFYDWHARVRKVSGDPSVRRVDCA